MRSRTRVVLIAAVVGLYVSQHMYVKARKAARGELAEASVVETPAAKLFFGQPNALFGLLYYTALIASTPLATLPAVLRARQVASIAAFASSAYLGYSLLFKTKQSCPYCWTSHAANLLLAVVLCVDPQTTDDARR